MGVPVEYCDSPAIERFQRVLAAAWGLAGAYPGRSWKLHELLEGYEEQCSRTDQDAVDCHATAEIAAAVQSFTVSRSARPGVYLYFDIGAGTIDGVAFRFHRQLGVAKLDFYCGKVNSLGLAAVASRAGAKLGPLIEGNLFNDQLPIQASVSLDAALFADDAKAIRQQVGTIVMAAKKRDRGDWLIDPHFYGTYSLRRVGRGIEHKKVLSVFIGGGAMQSPFYCDTIASTHEAHRLASASIPPIQLAQVPPPPGREFQFNGVPATEFHRFAIAYGLSIPVGEGPEVALPSQFPPAPFQPAPEPERGPVRYEDSKDAYE